MTNNLNESHPIDQWSAYPRKDEMVLLLVEFDEHSTDDARFAWTIGFNNDHNLTAEDAEGWKFAGWCWDHDHYVDGKGKPVRFLPIPHGEAVKLEWPGETR